jgi:putative peptide zinc metalloprotease protein
MNSYSDITIHHHYSSSVQKKKYLLSHNGKYYEVSHAIIELVEELQQYKEEETAIVAYIQKKEGKYSPEQVRKVIEKFIVPILHAVPKKQTFLYEKEVLSAEAIDQFSDLFRFLFHKVYMAVILAGMLVLNTWFFLTTHNLLLFNNKVNIYMATGLLVFMLASSFFHELGHASACKYFGIQHGGIGFGLYLNFPVLYTNVTEVWKLKRGQRCVVNLAGVYFQSYWLILLLVAFFVTGNDMLRYLILIMNLGFAMTLNPFFKFDGYWIASDLLGVPNLRQRSLELFSYMWNRLKKRPIKQLPYLLQIRRLERYGLLVYSVVVNLFMGYYFLYIIPTFLYRFVQTFPDAVNELILYLSNQMIPPFALLRNIGMQLIFLGLIVYLIYKSIIPLLKRHGRK